MVRARATSCAVSDSAGSPTADRLLRTLPDRVFMSSPTSTPAPATTSVTQAAVRVPADEAGDRLDRVLARHIAALSRSRLKVLIEAGAVAVDGQTIRDPSHNVNSGSAILVDVPPPLPAKPEPEPIPLRVIYEDDDIIVIDKPRNLVVHPAAGHRTGTLVNALIAHCGDSLSGIGGERRPGIVHRLDKDTTGAMVVAKNDRAHRALAAQFADHGKNGEPFERSYLALVWGAPDRPHGTIDRPIDRHPKSRERMAIREGGRDAVTHWQVLERYGVQAAKTGRKGNKGSSSAEPVASLLLCRLETGRTHQIRVHLASIGHPIMGDDAYGSGFRTKAALLPPAAQTALTALARQALHAHILLVKHPSSGEFLQFRSELPPDLVRLRNALAGTQPDIATMPQRKPDAGSN
ncbi:MAG TPA: RluA family pseudouridine synthase [Xanthobacteraceae bacterium]|nr:RluA family pseudouridine synthase [Xanthobacteraceae bacterium]